MNPDNQNLNYQNPDLAPAGLPRGPQDATNNSVYQNASLPQPAPQPSMQPSTDQLASYQQPPTPQEPVVLPPQPNGEDVKVRSNPNSTQNALMISEIRDGVVIMNDGSFRSVVMLKSINFELMSSQEQESVEYSYQGFLNSLVFPIQIFVRSQKIDIGPYIEKLDKIRSEHDNMLLAMLMEDYINFMIGLAEQTNIMDKKFYIIIPYYPTLNTQKAVEAGKSFLTGVFGKKEQHVVINETDLTTAKTELRNRVQSVLAGLMQCGVQGLPLDTQELIELYYDAYNPDTATRQQLKNFDELTAPVITKGEGFAPQEHLKRELQ